MKTIRDVMTTNVVTIQADATIMEAARRMRDDDIGDVVVLEHDRFAGILTDRDIVVRALAAEGYSADRPVREFATARVETLAPDASADEAIDVMRRSAVRRLPRRGGWPAGRDPEPWRPGDGARAGISPRRHQN